MDIIPYRFLLLKLYYFVKLGPQYYISFRPQILVYISSYERRNLLFPLFQCMYIMCMYNCMFVCILIYISFCHLYLSMYLLHRGKFNRPSLVSLAIPKVREQDKSSWSCSTTKDLEEGEETLGRQRHCSWWSWCKSNPGEGNAHMCLENRVWIASNR